MQSLKNKIRYFKGIMLWILVIFFVPILTFNAKKNFHKNYQTQRHYTFKYKKERIKNNRIE